MNGQEDSWLVVAHIPRGSSPSREAVARGVWNCRRVEYVMSLYSKAYTEVS